MRFLKIYSVVITLIFLCTTLPSAYILHQYGYDKVILAKLHIIDPPPTYNRHLEAWANSLDQLNVDADVVFYGDSITQLGDWRPYFPDLVIGNLGHAGDQIPHLEMRIDTVKVLSPKKLFLMIGINSLSTETPEQCAKEYAHLLDLLEKELPDTEIYVESLLPISKKRSEDETLRTRETVLALNSQIKALANERGLTYIDLYSVYEKDGYLNSDYSGDGLHLLPDAYELWAQTIRPYMEE